MSRVHDSYAKAFVESAREAGLDTQKTAAACAELKDVADSIASSVQLKSALSSPLLSGAEKEALLVGVAQKCGASERVIKFLRLLASKGRTTEVVGISQAVDRAHLEAQGVLLGYVESAEGLGEADLADLAVVFSKKTGKKVQFNTGKNPALLAGLRVQLQGTTYDGSLSGQLERLEEQFVMAGAQAHGEKMNQLRSN